VVEPVRVKACVMLLPTPAVAPVTPVWFTVHEKVVPGILLDNAMAVVSLEQIACDGGVAVIIGFGFTVITTEIGTPEQTPTVGVMEYVTVPIVAPVDNT